MSLCLRKKSGKRLYRIQGASLKAIIFAVGEVFKIRFVIIRLGIAALFIILRQLMLLLMAISSLAKVQLLLPEFFCDHEGTMQPLSIF